MPPSRVPSVTPTVLEHAPRKVHITAACAFGVWQVRLAFFVMLLFCAYLETNPHLSAATGVTLAAKVTTVIKWTEGNSWRYSVMYTYQADNHTFYDEARVSKEVYYQYNKLSDLPSGPMLQIRYCSLCIVSHSQLQSKYISTANHSHIPVLILVGVMQFLYWIGWIKPRQTRELYRWGEPARGTIVGKYELRGKNHWQYATFAYYLTTGEKFTNWIWVPSLEQLYDVSVGQSVTVLYSSRNPKRSTIYELGGYTIESISIAA